MGRENDAQGVESAGLPIQSTRLIGRSAELDEVQALLQDPSVRVVSLTGESGIGKTRLAVQAAAALRGEFPHGVWYLDMFVVRDAETVIPTLMKNLKYRFLGDEPLEVDMRRGLGDRQLLLVLDNCDHVDGISKPIQMLADAGEYLKIITCSRRPLDVPGEHRYDVGPLSLPDYDSVGESLSQYDSFELFTDRMKAIQPSVEISRADAQIIARICIQLNGLPLAIEMVAARTARYPLEALLSQVVRVMDDQEIKESAEIIHRVVGWNIEQLDEAHRVLLARLSVFVGGCRLDAAQAVCKDTPGLSLEEGLKNLNAAALAARSTNQEGIDRYTLPEVVRTAAWDRLLLSGEADQVLKRNAGYWVEWAANLHRSLPATHESTRPARQYEEEGNVRAVLAYTVETGLTEYAVRLVKEWWHWWAHHGWNREGAGWLRRLLESDHPLDPLQRVLALNHYANLISFLPGQTLPAITLYSQSLEIALEKQFEDRICVAYNNLGIMAMEDGRFDDARGLFEQSLAHVEPVKPNLHATVLANMCELMGAQGLFKEAREYGQRSIATAPKHSLEEPFTRSVYGRALLWEGDLKEAGKQLRPALEGLETSDAKGWVAVTHLDLCRLSLLENQLEAAHQHIRHSLVILQEVIRVYDMIRALEITGLVMAASGRPRYAVELLGAAAGAPRRLKIFMYPVERPVINGQIESLRTLLGSDDFDSAWERGIALALEPSLAYALEIIEGS